MSDKLEFASPCPKCRRVLDAAKCVSEPGREPSPGDVTLCLYCSTPLIFQESLAVRLMTSEEFEALDADSQRALRFARGMAGMFQHRQARRN